MNSPLGNSIAGTVMLGCFERVAKSRRTSIKVTGIVSNCTPLCRRSIRVFQGFGEKYRTESGDGTRS